MENLNDETKIKAAVRAFQSALYNRSGCIIALFPVSDVEWGMAVAMSDDTPIKVIEQLSDALMIGRFEVQFRDESSDDQ